MSVLVPLLLGVGLPALLAVVFLVPQARGWRSQGGAPRRLPWAAAPALGLGYLAGHWGILGWPSFPPPAAEDWIVVLVTAAVGLGVLEALWTSAPWVARWLLRGLLVAAVVGLVQRPMVQWTWTTGQSVAWGLGVGVALAVMWSSIEALAGRRPGASLPLVLVTVTAGSAVVLGLSGSARFAQQAGALAAGLGVVVVVSWWRPTLSWARVLPPVVVVVWGVLWQAGHLYADLATLPAVLLAASPLAAWLGEISVVTRRAGWQAASLRVFAVGMLVLAAALLALQGAAPAVEETGSGYGSYGGY